jgi:hypothetical protein
MVRRRVGEPGGTAVGTAHGGEPISPPACATLPAMRETAGRQDLPSIVLARGAADPEEPALFYPEGLEVRWRSWSALADQVAGGAAALAGSGLPAGAAVAFRWRPAPDAVAADLAVQAAGLTSAPVAEPAEAAAAGCAAWLLLPGEQAPAGAPAALRLPEAPRSRRASRAAAPLPAPLRAEPPAGGVRLADDGAGSCLPAAEVLARGRDLEARLERAGAGLAAAVAGARRPPREIALASFDLRTTGGRAFLTWALATGAALYLEPDPRALPGSVAWARPTLVAGSPRPLVELGRQARQRLERPARLRRRRSGPRPPFDRLRLLLVLGEGRLPVDDVAFWAGRGVAVLRVDQ